MAVTIPCVCLRSCQVRRRLGAGELWVWHFPKKPVDKEMETAERPKFLGNPDVLTPCSSTPARPTLSGRYDSLARPHAVTTARALHERLFRGSITRHRHSLSTLRSAAHAAPRKTRFWLLARLYQTGLVTRRIPTKGFRDASYIAFSFPKLSWRNVTPSWRMQTAAFTMAASVSFCWRRRDHDGIFLAGC